MIIIYFAHLTNVPIYTENMKKIMSRVQTERAQKKIRQDGKREFKKNLLRFDSSSLKKRKKKDKTQLTEKEGGKKMNK